MRRIAYLGVALTGITLLSPIVFAQTVVGATPATPNRDAFAYETAHGAVVATDANGVYAFNNWAEYYASRFFIENGMRCGTQLSNPYGGGVLAASASDCSNSNTNPAAAYDPSGAATYTIDVVVHVLQANNGSGAVSDASINSQIQILNQDFNAISGSLGGNGYNAKIQFNLAGVTRTTNNNYYNDGGSYWTSLAWDTTKYLNIYTNTAGGNLGYAYVPSGGGVVGNSWDRVVIYWASFGANAPIGSPYNLGRTVTHEVGHYLGLYHTFAGGCSSPSGCNQNGDLICDTNPESSPNFSPCTRTTCGSPDPTNNYMDYSDDICMTEFTVEQVRRMRCTLESFRVGLSGGGTGGTPPAKAASPSPSNGAGAVSTSTSLSWGSAAGATSYDVYFGTDSTPDAGELVGNPSGTSFNPGTLANSTTYYWRVDSKNSAGTTTGDVWSFDTAAGGAGGIALSVMGYKKKGKWHADLSWSGAAGSSVQIHRSKDGGPSELIATVSNNGSYTNITGFKGGGSLTFTVCELGGAVCSNPATANY